jgi:CheY-like chemotaxis protein
MALCPATALASAVEGLLVVDRAGALTYANPAAERILGRPAATSREASSEHRARGHLAARRADVVRERGRQREQILLQPGRVNAMKAAAMSSVLVIEDDPDMRGLLVIMLEEQGHIVRAAANGVAGLEAIHRERPDVILLDMEMPVMDGWELARRYRAEVGNPAPIVVMTASEDPRKPAEEIGAAGWLGEPVELDVLFETVRHIASRPQVTEARV